MIYECIQCENVHCAVYSAAEQTALETLQCSVLLLKLRHVLRADPDQPDILRVSTCTYEVN